MSEKKELHEGQIDLANLIDLLSEESNTTYQPHKVFSDPKKSGPIEKISTPKRGGIKTYIKGAKYPYPGYPDRDMIKTACIIKKIFIMSIRFFSSMANRQEMIKLIILKKNIQKFFPNMLLLFANIIGSRRLKERYYSHSVREIYRTFNVLIEREKNLDMRERWEKIRDVICLVLEFDSAYRSRAQDFLSELNIKKIKLTKGDLFFAKQSNDYRFGGKKIK